MARIIISIRQKTPLSKARVNLRAERGNRDTTAETNLMTRIVDNIAAAWDIGAVEVPRDLAGEAGAAAGKGATP